MSVKKQSTYLKGLGDLYVNAEREANPAVTIDNAEDISFWTGLSGATVALSQVQVQEGAYSVAVSNVIASGDGATWTPTTAEDYSDNEDTLLGVYVYPTCSDTIRIKVYEGVNYEEYLYSVTANEWNFVLVDLSAPVATSGTVDWSLIDKIEIFSTSGCDFYVDGMYFFDSIGDVARTEKVRVGCIQEIGLDTSDDTVELRCSNNEIVQTEIVSTTITLSATVKDFDPAGMALVGSGEVTTDSVTTQATETTTIPASGPYTYTLTQASVLKTGSGFGVWVYQTNKGALLQETPEDTIVVAGYYKIDSVTGELTFSSSDAGKGVTIVYNIVTSGRTFEAKTDRTFLEFSMQFKVRGSNQKEALLFFPRLKSSSFSLAPNREDFWEYKFEASVLADDVSGNYYELHIIE